MHQHPSTVEALVVVVFKTSGQVFLHCSAKHHKEHYTLVPNIIDIFKTPTHHNTMRSLQDKLQGLLEIVNHGTKALAATGMSDAELTEGFAWAFETEAAHAYAHLQEQEVCHTADDDEEVVDIAPLMSGTATTSLQVHNPMIFAKPFVVEEPEWNDMEEEEKNTTWSIPEEDVFVSLSAVATYNLGLAKHAQAYTVKTHQEHQGLLQQAKDLYQRAFDLINNHVPLDTEDGSFMFLFLVLSNNLAELCVELHLTDDAAEWQGTLQECIKSVRPSTLPVYQHLVNAALAYSITF